MENNHPALPKTPTFLLAQQLADLLGVEPSTIQKMRRKKTGPEPVRILLQRPHFNGNARPAWTYVYPVETLRPWLEENRPHKLAALDAIIGREG